MVSSMTRREALLGGAMLCSSAGLLARTARARDWPTHNIKLIVGGAAGSVPDSLARLAGDALSKKLGQSIVIENRASAGGIVAMRDLITSAPDGYTIALTTLSQAVFNSYLFSKLPYDPLVTSPRYPHWLRVRLYSLPIHLFPRRRLTRSSHSREKSLANC